MQVQRLSLLWWCTWLEWVYQHSRNTSRITYNNRIRWNISSNYSPAPTIAFCPIVKPGKMVVFAPMDAPLRTYVVGISVDIDGCAKRVVWSALGPINTSSSRVMPSHNCTPHLQWRDRPISTLFSIKTWSQILQIFGQFWHWEVRRAKPNSCILPIEFDSTEAWGCLKKFSVVFSIRIKFKWQWYCKIRSSFNFIINRFKIAT